MSASSSNKTFSELKTEISAIEMAVDDLKTKNDDDIRKAKEQLSRIAACRKGIANLAPGAEDTNPSEAEINALKTQIAILESRLGDLLYSTPPFHDNRKLFYQEAGQWGRHFSTVRMTVMTFTISTCAAIVAWKWQGKGPDIQPLLIPTATLWMIGVLSFWVFTYHTYKKVRSQKVLRDWMPDGIHNKDDAGDVKVDLASFVVPLFSVGLWFLAHQHDLITDHWHNAVAWGFVAASLTIPFGIAALFKRTKALKITTIAGVILTFVVAILGWNSSLLANASSPDQNPPQPQKTSAGTPQPETAKFITNYEKKSAK